MSKGSKQESLLELSVAQVLDGLNTGAITVVELLAAVLEHSKEHKEERKTPEICDETPDGYGIATILKNAYDHIERQQAIERERELDKCVVAWYS